MFQEVLTAVTHAETSKAIGKHGCCGINTRVTNMRQTNLSLTLAPKTATKCTACCLPPVEGSNGGTVGLKPRLPVSCLVDFNNTMFHQNVLSKKDLAYYCEKL